VPSSNDFKTTVFKLKQAVEAKGLTLFATVDHADNARRAAMDLPPTTLFVFGNPGIGTPLMQCNRSAAMDLPQKMLIWEEAGRVFIGYNRQDWLARRHMLGDCGAEKLDKAAKALNALAHEAAGK
jgi:uncharacterized protein (DUF302 family)